MKYCLYCKYYTPFISGAEGIEPDGMCHMSDEHCDSSGMHVYGHECCEAFKQKEIKK